MFTIEEIEIFMEALDAWENSAAAGAFFGSMLASVAAPDKEFAQREIDRQLAEAKEDKKSKKEKAILLKAKLINLKDQIATSEAADFLASGS